MYAREIDGEVYTFGVSGKLLRNTLVMYDHQTGSEWAQVLGQALTGPMTGAKLAHLPAGRMTWKEWRKRYPNTLALENPADVHGEYSPPRIGGGGTLREAIVDRRLNSHQRVIGVLVGDAPVAYPSFELEASPVLNDVVDETHLLITFNPNTGSAAVFDRALEGRVLTFAPDGHQAHAIKDKETGTDWDSLTGRAIAGPLKGKTLTRVPFTAAFWFGWKDNFPATRVYGE